MNKSLVQEEFGKTAAFYLTAKPQAEGKSLALLVALTAPQKHWRVLDVATGGGHVAYAFAPHVAEVCATDITPEMLDLVRAECTKRAISNVRVTDAGAENLPFEDASFDIVICRLAAHHFDSIPAFLGEVRRLLKPDGVFGLVDNVVPDGATGDYVNAFERLRDPSHLRAWTVPEWRAAIEAAGLRITHEETIDKTMEFRRWASRHGEAVQAMLRAMLTHAAGDVAAFFRPQGDGDALTFHFCEGLFIARRT